MNVGRTVLWDRYKSPPPSTNWPYLILESSVLGFHVYGLTT